MLVIVGLVLAVAAAAIFAKVWSDRRSEQRLWSLLPHTMGCVLDPDPYMRIPPASVAAQQIDIEHLGGRRIAVRVTFSAPPPPAPVAVQTRYGEVRNRPGGIDYLVSVRDPQSDASITAYSPTEGRPWQAIGMSTKASRSMDFADRQEVPLEVSISGNEVRLVLDLPANAEHLSHPPFAPSITIQSSMSDPAVLADPESVGILFKPQDCQWSSPVAAVADLPTATTPPRGSAPPARVPEPQLPAGFPADGKPCPPKYGPTGAYTRSAVGNGETSCPFAEEVRISYADMGNPGSTQDIKVFSPTTQQMYDMTCQPVADRIVCTGGNGAVVYLD